MLQQNIIYLDDWVFWCPLKFCTSLASPSSRPWYSGSNMHVFTGLEGVQCHYIKIHSFIYAILAHHILCCFGIGDGAVNEIFPATVLALKGLRMRPLILTVTSQEGIAVFYRGRNWTIKQLGQGHEVKRGEPSLSDSNIQALSATILGEAGALPPLFARTPWVLKKPAGCFWEFHGSPWYL